MEKKKLNIGLIGLGVIGSKIFEIITDLESHNYSKLINVKTIVVKDLSKKRNFIFNKTKISSNINDILDDEEIDLVVEVVGGEIPAFDYISKCLKSGKDVVTANKEVMAKRGLELLAIAKNSSTQLRFEASVGGGIPIISSLKNDFSSNKIDGIRAIINGTTNYILTRMSNEGLSFREILNDAQKLGYAETDPTNDVEGFDSTYKLAILTNLAFGAKVEIKKIYREGITNIKNKEFKYANELGFSIKLISSVKKINNKLLLRVHPALIPIEIPMANVNSVLNMIEVHGNLTGPLWFQGAGAGPDTTSSALLNDIFRIMDGISKSEENKTKIFEEKFSLINMDYHNSKYYLRITIKDKAGVLARLSKILGDNGISIHTVLQKDTNIELKNAELVVMTHKAQEKIMLEAIKKIKKLEDLVTFDSLLRVEEY